MEVPVRSCFRLVCEDPSSPAVFEINSKHLFQPEYFFNEAVVVASVCTRDKLFGSSLWLLFLVEMYTIVRQNTGFQMSVSTVEPCLKSRIVTNGKYSLFLLSCRSWQPFKIKDG